MGKILDGSFLLLKDFPTEIIDQTDAAADRRKPFVGIVLTKQDTVFGTGSKHPVRLIHAFGHQVVDQHTDISLVALEDQRLLAGQLEMRIDAGHQALRGGFFVAGRAVDLSGQIEAGDDARFQRGLQLCRIEEIVFHGIGRAEDPYLLQPLDGVKGVDLCLERKRRGKTLQIVFKGIPAFRLEKELMRILVGKGAELVFDRRTVARADAMDLSREERRAVETCTKNLVDSFVRPDDVAALLRPALLDGGRYGKERKAFRRTVTFLHFQAGKIDRPDVDAGRRAGLHPADRQAGISQNPGKTLRRKFAHPASFRHLGSYKETTLKESSGRQNHRFGLEFCAHPQSDTVNMRFSERYLAYRILPNI